MIEPLEFLRERAAERELESVEADLLFLGRLEDVDAALIGGSDVVDVETAEERDGFR